MALTAANNERSPIRRAIRLPNTTPTTTFGRNSFTTESYSALSAGIPPTCRTAPGTPVIAATSEERTSRTHRINSPGVRWAVGNNSIRVAWPSLLNKLLRIGSATSWTASAVSDIPVRVGRDKTSSALGSLWKCWVRRVMACQPAGESAGDCGGNSRTTRRDCTIPDRPIP